MRIRAFVLVISGLCYAAGCSRDSAPAKAPEPAHIYITQDTIEVDTLASLWLIARFIDQKAEFKFVPKGTLITGGIAFDTPDADYRRTATAACFESLLQKNNLADTNLVQLGRIVHDIEINYWGEKKYAQTPVIQQAVNAIIDRNRKDPQACMNEGLQYFDTLHLPRQMPGNSGQAGRHLYPPP